MNCPDIERLLDVALGAAVDPETEAHLRGCADCRMLMRFATETEAAFTPAMDVPEALIASTVGSLIAESTQAVRHVSDVSLWEAVPTGLLAAMTVLLAGIFTGSFQGGGPVVGLVACALSGLGAVIYEVRGGPRTA